MWGVEPTAVANGEQRREEKQEKNGGRNEERRRKRKRKRKRKKTTVLVYQVRFKSLRACRFPPNGNLRLARGGSLPSSAACPLLISSSPLLSVCFLSPLIFPPRQAKQWNAMQCSSSPATCALARQLKIMPTSKGAEQDPIGPLLVVWSSPFCKPMLPLLMAGLDRLSLAQPVKVKPAQARKPSHCLCEHRGIAS